jgi:RNA polymerase sigma-70 factor (ECF subfamily)
MNVIPVTTDTESAMPQPGGLRIAISAAVGGDDAAFQGLMEERLSRTFRVALAILGAEADARDATQDAWLQVWRQLGTLRDPDRFDAWLDRIVVNACRMTVRRKRVREIPMPTDFDRAGTLDDPDGLAERDALERAFDRLTVDHRAVLVLHHVEERSVAEIAGVLQIPVGTVKSRLHAARSQLERALEADR